ncbi:MAG: bifunctional oligoribonuclease/PAP phosphatase NrnA, partial [Muribaculaceae bacterium]|nr:bifunctional oligoribonuclease/PAP phosphatase NrnA [Muribaculaceae bacterium]
DVAKLKKLIKGSKRIVLTCHVHPDGAAVGSTLGFWHLLRKLGKEASVVVPDQLPKSLRFLPGAGEIAVYTRHDPYCTRLVEGAELIICCDFNTASRQDHLAPLIQGSGAAKVLIDHHEDPDMSCEVVFSFPKMSSTCELVFRVIAALGLYEEVDKDCATCILCGMITDTQNFTVNCPDPEIYEVMMRLIEKGADKTKIIEECVKACSYDSLRLKSFALSERMEVFPKHRAIITSLSKEDLSRFHYEKGDTEGLVNMPLNIRGIVYSIFLREDADQIKISARSRYDFPVSKICADLFGGGGHIQAAGGEFKGSLKDCLDILKDSLDKYDSYLPERLERIDWRNE